MKQAEILIPTALGHGFDYRVPEGAGLAAGDIVGVPFGRGGSLGVVWAEGTAKLDEAKMKTVAVRHVEFSPFSPSMRQFIDWAAWYNCAPKGSMLKMALPLDDIAKKPRGKKSDPHPTPLPHAGEGSVSAARAGEGFYLAQLSEEQQKAAAVLKEKIGKGFSVTLLDGVTGSGKTEVYFDAIAEALKTPDHQVLVLLPEIALSVQWLERFEKRFGFSPVVWNSEITHAKKRAAWLAINKGEARVVVGARSALFLPYKNLSLLIIDEEHDASYKQEDGVIYHARDMAVARARFERLPVILVSATPSLETYYNVKQKKYAETSLPSRHGEAVLPDIHMLDMRKVETESGAFLSQPLRERLARTLAAGDQAMLFLNRRGYAPLMLCRTCGHRFQCPDCSSWLVLHKGRPRLECHHCGYKLPVPDACPACNHKESLQPCGPGVERVLEEVKSFLPQASIRVLASDQAGFKEINDIIAAMEAREIDILIGTQMIAKGHHFPSLSLVGVVDADLGLAGGDLRAAERTYQLLHQLSGRAGRAETRGDVYLQSFLPEHPVMQALLSGKRDAFMAAELQARERAQMPPFSRLAAVIVEGAQEDQVSGLARQLIQSAGISEGLRILGPAPAPLYLLRGKYRQRLLVKAQRNVNLPDYLRNWLETRNIPRSLRVKIDMDPMSFL